MLNITFKSWIWLPTTKINSSFLISTLLSIWLYFTEQIYVIWKRTRDLIFQLDKYDFSSIYELVNTFRGEGTVLSIYVLNCPKRKKNAPSLTLASVTTDGVKEQIWTSFLPNAVPVQSETRQNMERVQKLLATAEV